MSDTVRTFTDLQSLLATNGVQGISAQDLRDFLASAMGVYGQLYITGNSTAQGSIGTSFVTLDWAQGADGEEDNADVDYTNDQIEVGALGDGVYEIHFQLSGTGTASTVFEFAIAVNGTEDDASHCLLAMDASSTVQSCSIHSLVQLADGDIVTVSVKADGASKSLTPKEAQLTIKRLK